MESNKANRLLGLTRIALGLIFLWVFFDKLFGLGFATASGKAWLSGSSPTAGFLASATHGPLAPFYQGLAGSELVDWLFMLGILGIGISLTLGIFMKLASYSGAVLMLLMWSALFPPKNHPFLDEHIIYLLILIVLSALNAGDYLGLGKKWSKTRIVKKYPFLK